ncbi:sensor protein TorS [bacterium BMS3Abin14]|nr:sensor protein TorS [bacterium BMS3Abin14]
MFRKRDGEAILARDLKKTCNMMDIVAPVPGTKRILIVDDDPLTAQALVRSLRQDGHDILVIGNGMRALYEIQANPYALVFLEIQISDKSGMYVLREIRRTSPSTCVVVMSVDIPNDEVKEAIERFAQLFLPKPFEMLQVRKLATQALAKADPH